MWKYYALLSAFFAAMTAICAKVGVKDVNSDLATAIRTFVILLLTWGIVLAFIFLKEEVSLRVIVGVLLITGGSIVMLVK